MTGRRRTGLIVGFVIAAVMLLVVGGSAVLLLKQRGSATSGPSTSVTSNFASSSTWADYFTPARVGYSCALVAEQDGGALITTYTTTHTVTAVTTTGGDTLIEVAEVRERFAREPGSERLLFPHRVEHDLAYTVARDGTLHTSPLAISSMAGTPQTDDAVVYPSIDDLRNGRSRESVATIRSSSIGVDDIVEGAPSMRVTVLVEGVDSSPVRARAGTFTDVVVVRSTFVDLEYLNLSAEEQASVDEMKDVALDLLGETTTWYARGVGAVRSEILLGPQRIVFEASECTG